MTASTRAPRHAATLIVSLEERGAVWGMTRNLSRSGMLLDVAWRPPVDTEVGILLRWCADAYRCRAKVVRHADTGVAIKFVEPPGQFHDAIASVVSCTGSVCTVAV